MTRHSRTTLAPVQRRDPVELVGVAVRPSDHFTRLWPSSPHRPTDAPLFLAAMSPLRLAALALLWATSSPGRFVAGLAVAAALVAVLVVAL